MKTHQVPFPAAIGLTLLLITSCIHAAVLASYAMTAAGDPLNGTLNVNPTTTIANVTATGLVNQAGAGAAGSFAYNGGTDRASSWSITVGSTNTTFADAVTVGNYVTLNITPSPGYEIDLGSITFQVASGSSNTTSNRGFFLVSEVLPADFTTASTVLSSDRTPGGSGTIPVQSGTSGTTTIPKDYSVDLASLPSFTATRYFRFYLQGPVSTSLTFDDIVINGSVTAIPEPASTWICGIGALLLLRRRRSAALVP